MRLTESIFAVILLAALCSGSVSCDSEDEPSDQPEDVGDSGTDGHIDDVRVDSSPDDGVDDGESADADADTSAEAEDEFRNLAYVTPGEGVSNVTANFVMEMFAQAAPAVAGHEAGHLLGLHNEIQQIGIMGYSQYHDLGPIEENILELLESDVNIVECTPDCQPFN